MAIKVIQGPRPLRLFSGNCRQCGTVIECNEKDLEYEDRPCGTSFVRCPNCKGMIHPEEISRGN